MPIAEFPAFFRLLPPIVWTVGLLVVSNVFMTFAWYGHLKYTDKPLVLAIVVSWAIAFVEYCFQVPANRIGYVNDIPAVQLKTIQEVVTLLVFAGFSFAYLKEPLRWNHGVGFALIVAAVFFVFKKW
ncbi:MAG: DMT family protein [Deltaproteobacteria bacterium]|nr:DMT family protein [Deltaproteobacteria bacterium]